MITWIRRKYRWLKLLYGKPRDLPFRDLRIDPEPIAIDWQAMRERVPR